MRLVIRLFIVIGALSAVTLGCDAAPEDEQIVLPETPVIALRPSWALVVEPYVRLFEEPATDAPIAGHLRSGEVARIDSIGTQPVRIGGVLYRWYQLSTEESGGWMVGRSIETFTSRDRAANAARNRFGGE
ncbi:MAG: hypothetical protein ACLFP4_12465 [Spirochaetales bacterium]